MVLGPRIGLAEQRNHLNRPMERAIESVHWTMFLQASFRERIYKLRAAAPCLTYGSQIHRTPG